MHFFHAIVHTLKNQQKYASAYYLLLWQLKWIQSNQPELGIAVLWWVHLYHNKAQSWQVSNVSEVDLSPLHRTKAAAPFSVRFYPASAAGIPGSCSSWKSSQEGKCGSRCPLPDWDAQVGTLWMVGLEINRAKVSPDNALGKVSKRGWMELEATKPHSHLILKVSHERPLWLWDLKNAATGSRSQLQPDADEARGWKWTLRWHKSSPPQAWL